MQEKGLWKAIGHWPSKQKTEISSTQRKDSGNDDDRSHRSSRTQMLQPAESKTNSKKSSRLLNPPMINPPITRAQTTEDEKGFKMFLDLFKVMTETEKSLTDKEESSEKQLLEADVGEISPIPARPRQKPKCTKGIDVIHRLVGCVQEYIAKAREEYAAIRSEILQDKIQFMSNINELHMISSVFFSKTDPNPASPPQTVEEDVLSEVQSLHDCRQVINHNNQESTSRLDQEMLRKESLFLEEIAKLQSEKEKLEVKLECLNNQRLQTAASASVPTEAMIDEMLRTKYEDLLKQAQRLYTNIINENKRTIESLKKDLQLKTEEAIKADRRLIELEAQTSRVMGEMCSKRYKILYDKSEDEKMALEGKLEEFAAETYELRANFEKIQKQDYNLHKENAIFREEIKFLKEQLERLRDMKQGQQNQLLMQFERENRELKEVISDRNSALEAMKNTLMEMKKAYVEAAKNIYREEHQANTEQYRSSKRHNIATQIMETDRTNEPYCKSEASQHRLLNYYTRTSTSNNFSPHHRKILEEQRLRSSYGHSKPYSRASPARDNEYGVCYLSKAKVKLASPLAAKANRLSQIIQEDLKRSQQRL